MALMYRFKKEKLDNGSFVLRPRIAIILQGKDYSIEVPALIDSGADKTVIPESLARAVGLNLEGGRDTLIAFREENSVVHSKAAVTFMSKHKREQVTLTIPILIVLSKGNIVDEEDVVLGVDGVFDAFDILFSKTANKIRLKRVSSDKITKNLQNT